MLRLVPSVETLGHSQKSLTGLGLDELLEVKIGSQQALYCAGYLALRHVTQWTCVTKPGSPIYTPSPKRLASRDANLRRATA